MSDEEAWVRFAAAALGGSLANEQTLPAAKSAPSEAKIAGMMADDLLAEFRKRFPAKG